MKTSGERWQRLCGLLALAVPALLAGSARAAPPEAPAQRTHTVRAGDTFYGLAGRYLRNAARWPELVRANPRHAVTRLPPGALLQIPAAEPVATFSVEVLRTLGAVTVVRKGAGAQPLLAGFVLREGDAVQVPHGGFALLQLQDGSQARLSEDTELTFESLRRAQSGPDSTSVFGVRLDKGRIDSQVEPRTGGSRYEVRTPLAVAAVRGTQFGVAAHARGVAVDVLEGVVAVTPTRGAQVPPVGALRGAYVDAVRAAEAHDLLPAPDLAAAVALEGDGAAEISFAPLPQAAAYSMVLARDAALRDVVATQTAAQPSWQLAALAPGEYQLAVRAVDARGLQGPAAQRPLVPLPRPQVPYWLEPAPGAVLRAGAAWSLRCTEVEGADSYRLQVASVAGFATPLVDTVAPGRCALEAAAALPEGAYAWRVASARHLPDGRIWTGAFSNGSAFEVRAQPVARVAQLSGQGEAPSMRWEGGEGLQFHVQLSRDPAFGTVWREVRQDKAELALSDIPAGEYHVRINTIGPGGIASGFSAARRFRIGAYLTSEHGGVVTNAFGERIELP